ncbi:MAG: VanZ family protein [Saprospiraceae bacterium]
MKSFLPTLIWLVFITALSISPSVKLPKYELFSADKLAHAGAYAVLVGCLAWGVWGTKKRAITNMDLFLLFCVSTLYGALMEGIQGWFFPNRFFEIDDMLANASGSFLAAIAIAIYSKRTQPVQHKP